MDNENMVETQELEQISEEVTTQDTVTEPVYDDDNLSYDDMLNLMDSHINQDKELKQEEPEEKIEPKPDKGDQQQDNINNQEPAQERAALNIDPELLAKDPRMQAFKVLYDAGLDKEEALKMAYESQPEQPITPRYQFEEHQIRDLHRLAKAPTANDITGYIQQKTGVNLADYFTNTLGEDDDTKKIMTFFMSKFLQSESQELLRGYSEEQRNRLELEKSQISLQERLISKLYEDISELKSVNETVQKIVIEDIIKDFGGLITPIGQKIFQRPELIEKFFKQALTRGKQKHGSILSAYSVNDPKKQTEQLDKIKQDKLKTINKFSTTTKQAQVSNGGYSAVDFEKDLNSGKIKPNDYGTIARLFNQVKK